MSAAPDCLEFRTLRDHWKPRAADVSADYAVSLRTYDASPVILIPISSAERDGERLVSKKPVAVTLTSSMDGTSAENDSLKIFAFGEDPEEALADFRSQLIELYEHYSKLSDDEVMGEAQVLRKRFNENFRLLSST
jgi:hypothetical protein